MKLAIMQPYLFPYLGYFQLIHAVDRFVFLDDVNFIRRGWINRNRWLIGGQPQYFTVPVTEGSQNSHICDLKVSTDPRWQRKLDQTIRQSYGKAAYFEPVYQLFASTVLFGMGNIGAMARASVEAVSRYLELPVQLIASSAGYGNQALKGEARIIDICRREGATSYFNLPGGRSLYQESAFLQHDVALNFIEPRLPAYPQCSAVFVPGLSILDVLMHNDPQSIRMMLQ